MSDTSEYWYQKLEEKYGYDYCLEAGYFDEYKPFSETYSEVYNLPKDSKVIQFSGAFYPIHEGHWEILRSAIENILVRELIFSEYDLGEAYYVIHVDHSGYRHQKGSYSEELFMEKFNYHLGQKYGFKPFFVFEDKMKNGCSRNFTRLYKELLDRNNDVYFLCGGDRANFALTFKDQGKCIVSGRDSHPNFEKYSYLNNNRIWFIEGDNDTSSTKIRNEYNSK